MSFLSLSPEFLKIISEQAEKEYPQECCGVILGPVGKTSYSRIQPFRNAQNEYRQKDPENFPRTAQSAYFINPTELLALQKEMRTNQEEIKIIYHSHIDAKAYFSEEDKRQALFEGQPVYPGTIYLILSVIKGKVQDKSFFGWNALKTDFVGI